MPQAGNLCVRINECRNVIMSDPDLSVIIPSVNSYDDLHSCLTALAAQTSAVAEVIVVDRLGDALRTAAR